MQSLRILLVAAVAASFAGLTPVPASAGCYREGLSGYHWHHDCIGPRFLYPHHRVCHRRHHRYCRYY